MPTPESLRILTAVVTVGLMAMGLRRPLWAVIGYMVLVYCKVSTYFPVFAGIKAELTFAGLILAIIVLKGHFEGDGVVWRNSVNKYLGLFMGCVLVSFFVAIDHRHSWDNGMYHFLKSLVFFLLLVLALKRKEDIKVFVWALTIMYAYLAYEPIFGFLTGTDASRHIYGENYIADVGLLSGHVALANNMNQMIPIALFLIPTIQGKKLKILGGIPLVIFLIALIGSGSRGGVAGLIGCCGALVYFSKKRLRNAMVLGALTVLLFGVSVSLKHTAGRIESSAAEGRLMGLIHGIEMVRIKGHILGVGPGCFALARGRYFGYTLDSHNLYGEVIGELGVVGTIVWAFFIFQVFRNLSDSRRKLEALSLDKDFLYKIATGVEISLIVRLFISMASHGLYFFYWYMVAALSIAISRVVATIESAEGNHSLDEAIRPGTGGRLGNGDL